MTWVDKGISVRSAWVWKNIFCTCFGGRVRRRPGGVDILLLAVVVRFGDAMAKGLKKSFEDWRKKGKENPFILFIDEIDSIGARGSNDHNDSWFRTIINTWLAFLDGAEPRTGIVIICCHQSSR